MLGSIASDQDTDGSFYALAPADDRFSITAATEATAREAVENQIQEDENRLALEETDSTFGRRIPEPSRGSHDTGD